MINKNENERRISVANEIAQKYNIETSHKGLMDLKKDSDEYKIKLLFVGGYSSGKSALLNCLIGRYTLEEDQKAETALATELYYTQGKDYIVTNRIDGMRVKGELNSEINVDEVMNLEYHLNSNNLKTLSDYIIVDTPGFDSGIEKHNKALMQYVDRGTAYVLVVDCEHGTVPNSAIDFIEEVSQYSGDVAVVINKCDKKPASEVKKIKENVSQTMQAVTGKECQVICTSIFDENIQEKLLELISVFEPQKLYDKDITSQINEEVDSLVRALVSVKKKQKLDYDEIDSEIQKREEIKRKLHTQLEKERIKVKNRLRNEVKASIIAKINAELMRNVETLAVAYNTGAEYLQERIVQIIRPILISSMEKNMEIEFEKVVKDINVNIMDDNSVENITETLSNITDRLKGIENSNLLQKFNEDQADSEKNKRIYRAITSILGMATNVVAPGLEILIVFLPDIINLINNLTGNTKEQKIKDAIQHEVIPQVMHKLREQLEGSFDEIEEIIIRNISENINEMISIENQALEFAKQQKLEKKESYDSFIEALEKDIQILQGEK